MVPVLGPRVQRHLVAVLGEVERRRQSSVASPKHRHPHSRPPRCEGPTLCGGDLRYLFASGGPPTGMPVIQATRLPRLLGADLEVAVRRRLPAALREPRQRGEHARDGGRVGRRRGVRAVVQQRAPRQRRQVARARPPRSRTRAAASPRFVGARADDDVVFVRNTTEAINVLAAALPDGHARPQQPGRAPRQHAAVAPPRPASCCRSRGRRTSCWRRASSRCARGASTCVAVTGASNVTGEVWPRGRAGGDRAPPRRRAVRRRRAARAAPADRHGGERHRPPRPVGPQALRAVRRRRARRRRAAAARRARRCCTAAARSSSSRSTT